VPDDSGLRLVPQPPVAPVGSLGAAVEGLGDLGPGRTTVKCPGDGQFPFGGQLLELTRELVDPLQWGCRHVGEGRDPGPVPSTCIDAT
jgi:hypothetical protein